jgi:hypothetical protein
MSVLDDPIICTLKATLPTNAIHDEGNPGSPETGPSLLSYVISLFDAVRLMRLKASE